MNKEKFSKILLELLEMLRIMELFNLDLDTIKEMIDYKSIKDKN